MEDDLRGWSVWSLDVFVLLCFVTTPFIFAPRMPVGVVGGWMEDDLRGWSVWSIEHACGTSFWFESRTLDARHSSAVTVPLFEGIVRENGPVTALVTGFAMGGVPQQYHEQGSGMASWSFCLLARCRLRAFRAGSRAVAASKRPALRPWRNRPYVLEALWHLEGLRAEWQRDFSATHRG